MYLLLKRSELHEKIKEGKNVTRVQLEECVVQYVKNKFGLDIDSRGTKSLHDLIKMYFFSFLL